MIKAAQSFRHFFQVPYLGNETAYRRARLLSFLVNLHLAIAVVVTILFSTIAFSSYVFPIVAFTSCIPALAIRLLICQGRVRIGAYVFLGMVSVLMPLAAFAGRGSVGTVSVTSFQFITIIMAGLLLDEIEVLFFVLLTLLVNGGLLYAEFRGIYDISTIIRNPLILWITQTITYSAGAALVWMANRLIKESFQRAGHELEERTQAEKREQSYREMLERVIRIGKTVAEDADLDTTLIRIWKSVREELGFDRVGIFLYKPDENIFHGSYGTNRKGEMAQEWHIRFAVDGDAFLRTALNDPNGCFFTDDYASLYKVPPGHVMEGVKHNAAVACWSKDKPVAVISVDQLLTGRPITEEQLEALRLFAGYVGLAIESARTSEHEKQHRRMLEKVIHLGKIVTETTDFRTTLKRIWSGVREELEFDRVGIFLYVPEDNVMQGCYGTDNTGHMTEEWQVKFHLDRGSFFDTVVRRPDGYYFTDDYEKTNATHDEIMDGVKHNAAVACWSGDQPVAIISVDNRITSRVITQDQLEALRLFAGYAGLAIQNSRLNSELEGRIHEREKFIEELGTKNAELERFTYTVSHELKSPIVTINNFLGLIDRDLSQKKYDTVQNDFGRIVRATTKMHETLSDLLELSRIGRVINPYEVIDVAKMVKSALETVHGRIADKHVKIKVADHFPTLYGDRIRLLEVFENLIDNAAKYTGNQKHPTIEIGVRDEKVPVFYVKDNGIGIDLQYHTRVFGLFDKLDSTSEGTGIGLALIKRIIEVHGGDIWVESEGSGKGSTFCFTVPDSRKEKTTPLK